MKRRNFSPEFKRESAQLVADQNYTVSDAAKAMDVGLSTMTKISQCFFYHHVNDRILCQFIVAGIVNPIPETQLLLLHPFLFF